MDGPALSHTIKPVPQWPKMALELTVWSLWFTLHSIKEKLIHLEDGTALLSS